ncbi:hypothetical protein FB451DRAFT_187261 [Mycena latifolia]|nr:hypothetical protein FB451DRAFT_187261 [Mycena latifolia]
MLADRTFIRLFSRTGIVQLWIVVCGRSSRPCRKVTPVLPTPAKSMKLPCSFFSESGITLLGPSCEGDVGQLFGRHEQKEAKVSASALIAMSVTPSSPGDGDRQPIRSKSIHQGAERMIALIEAEIQVHTAIARKEIADLRAALEDARRREEQARVGEGAARAQIQQTDKHIDSLVGLLAMFGVTCRRDGEVVEYAKEWGGLFDALEAVDVDAGSDAEDDVKAEQSPVDLSKAQIADPMRDLARVRLLLEKNQTEAERWMEKFLEMEMDRDEQKKAMGREVDALRRELKLAQTKTPSFLQVSGPSK